MGDVIGSSKIIFLREDWKDFGEDGKNGLIIISNNDKIYWSDSWLILLFQKGKELMNNSR